MIVKIVPAQVTYNAIQKRLNELGKGDSMRTVMRKAINELATDTKNTLHREVRARYTIQASEFKKADIRKKSASARRLEAHLRVRGPSVAIYKYKNEGNSEHEAAKAMIIKSGTMKELERNAGGRSYKAFIAKMESGHEGIFQRVPNKKMKSNPQKDAIKELMSLSEAKAAGKVYEQEIDGDMQGELRYRMLKHMNAVIDGRMGK